MSDKSFLRVSWGHPCSNCDHKDYCMYSEDGAVMCMRHEMPNCSLTKQNSLGDTMYLFFPDTMNDERKLYFTSMPFSGFFPNEVRFDSVARDGVYRALLSLLPLREDHMMHLLEKRRYSVNELKSECFASTPEKDRWKKIIDELHLLGWHPEDLVKVPGFAMGIEGRIVAADIPPGFFVPSFNRDGHITRLLVRADEDCKVKYLTFSATAKGGISAEMECHYPTKRPETKTDVIIIVGGRIKADIVYRETGIYTIGLPSENSVNLAIKAAESLGAKTLIWAIDADARQKKAIAGAMCAGLVNAKKAGFNLVLYQWDHTLGKGLDDILMSPDKGKVKQFKDESLWKLAQEINLAAGKEKNYHIEARRILWNLIEETEKDATHPFTDNIKQALAYLDQGSREFQGYFMKLKKLLGAEFFKDLKKQVAEAKTAINRFERVTDAIKKDKDILMRWDHPSLGKHALGELTWYGNKENHDHLAWDSAFWKYNPEFGVWSYLKDELVNNCIWELSGCPRIDGKEMEVFEPMVHGARKYLANKLAFIPEHADDKFFCDRPAGLAFANGYVTIDTLGAISLVKHSPTHKCQNRYDFDWIDDGVPEMLFGAMKTAWRGCPDLEQRMLRFGEFGGAALLGKATSYQSILVLKGKPNSSKSTYLDILDRLFPKGSVSAVKPQDMEEPYWKYDLIGKLLNAIDDMPQDDFLNTGSFKTIVVGKRINGRLPGHPVVSFKPFAAHVFCCEELPATKDTGDGFARRQCVLTFPNEIKPEEKIIDFHEKVLEAEQDKIVSWMIRCYAAMVARGPKSGYTEVPSSVVEVAEWMRESCSVASWKHQDTIETDKDEHQIYSDDAYVAYREWCERNGQNAFKEQNFRKRLRRLLKTDMPPRGTKGQKYPLGIPAKSKKLQQDAQEQADFKALFDNV